jgi:hypothetical protein
VSHFTAVRTQIVEHDFLTRALTDLNLKFEVGKTEIRGFAGRTTSVDVRIFTDNPSYDIGLRRSAAGFELVADWWGIRGMHQKEFLAKLTQRYAYHATCEKLKSQGFELVRDEVNNEGRIHLLLRRMS